MAELNLEDIFELPSVPKRRLDHLVCRTLYLFLFTALCAVRVLAQSCPLPPALHSLPLGRDIFTDEQESDLGDILSDSLVRNESVVADDALSAHLQQVASKIARYLPENHFRLQFSLIELPEANAFALPGGRVYVSRKLVASLKSDDELAGILAHELGHVVTHQAAIQMTEAMRQVLGVISVAGRGDIADKIHRMSETWAAHKLHIKESEEQDQQVADQVALYALARAGFKVQAFADALNRTVAIHGKTGNWITDLFHTTKPEQRRLREVINSISVMPQGCAAVDLFSSDSGFTDWQLKVIAYRQPAGHEELAGVLFREKLAQPLRPGVFNVHFSLDGKYILAQDEGGIHVLSQNPLKYLLFIETRRSYRALFAPDSKSIVFYTPDLRIETWNIATQQRVLVREMALNTSCIQTALAPDGKSLACYDGDDTLWLFDTATGSPIVERKNFLRTRSMGLVLISHPISDSTVNSDSGAPFRFAHLGFSPDGKYFLAGGWTSAFSYDLLGKREAVVGRGVRNAIKDQFVFLGNDRIAAVNTEKPSKSPVLRFPSGE
jgi:hypothetical protein